jgi:hypothetical protein
MTVRDPLPNALGRASGAAAQPRADLQARTADHQPAKPAHETTAARRRLTELMVGNFVTQTIYLIARLGIADLLEAAPLSAAQLAQRTGTNLRALEGMLRAMVSLDVLARDHEGRFTLRPMCLLLRSYPGWRSQVLLLGEEYFRSSAELMHTVMTGEPAFDRAYGKSFYDHFTKDPVASSRFHEVMTLSAPLRYAEIPYAFDFGRIARLVDVGSGQGGLTSLILKTYPRLKAVLFDAPQVISATENFLRNEGVLDRCELVGGDFFASIPPGGDAYLLSSVVVNWDDDRALTLLRNCHGAMSAEARLIIVDQAFLDGTPPSAAAAVTAVAAYAIQGSITRTESEYRALLDRAGFRIEEIKPLSYEPFVMLHAHPL